MPAFVSAEVGVSDRLPVGVLDAECLFQLTDGPERRQPAGCHHPRVIAGLSGFFALSHVLVRSER